jgi:hypothetical protein
MAAKQLTDQVEPLIRTASSEGLSSEEISAVLDELIRRINLKKESKAKN